MVKYVWNELSYSLSRNISVYMGGNFLYWAIPVKEKRPHTIMFYYFRRCHDNCLSFYTYHKTLLLGNIDYERSTSRPTLSLCNGDRRITKQYTRWSWRYTKTREYHHLISMNSRQLLCYTIGHLWLS
jgi:hypothetical protein